MKKLILLISLLLLSCVALADPPAPNLYSPFALVSDYYYNSGTNADAPGSPYEFQGMYSVIQGTAATSLTTPGYTQSMISAMPKKLKSLTLSFATGTCGSETWTIPGVTAAQFAAINLPAFAAAGKTAIIAAGGSALAFKCNTASGDLDSTNFMKFVDTYAQYPATTGVNIDVEGFVDTTGNSWQGYICNEACGAAGNIMRVTGTINRAPVCGQEVYGNGVAVGAAYILGSAKCVNGLPSTTPAMCGTIACTGAEGASGTGTYLLSTVTDGITTVNTTGYPTPVTIGSQTPRYSRTDINNLVRGMALAQVKYPDLTWGFTSSSYGGSITSYSLTQMGIWELAAFQSYGVNNYIMVLEVMDSITDSAHCVILSTLCDYGATGVAALTNANAIYGVPFNHLGISIMMGGNDGNGTVSFFTTSNVYTLSQFIRTKGVKFIGPWSFSRDNDCATQGGSSAASDYCNNYGSVGTAGILGFTNRFLNNLGY